MRGFQRPLDLLHRCVRLVDAQEEERARKSEPIRGHDSQQPAGATALHHPQGQPRQRHSVRMQETDGPLRQDVRRGRGGGGAGGARGRRGEGRGHGGEVSSAKVLHSGGAGQGADG